MELLRIYLRILLAGLTGLALSLRAADSPGVTPRRGGTLHLGRTADPQSMDPAICYDVEGLFIGRLVFRGLLDFDERMIVYPKQATDWGVSPDQKTYTFHLKPGVRFANGRPVEAEDYIYALQRIIDPNTQSPGETFYTGIVGAKDYQQGKAKTVRGLSAPDPLTLVIELTEPDYTFPSKMAMTFASPVPRDVVEAEGKKFWLHPFGSGPYRLVEWRRGIEMRFERSPVVNLPNEGFFDGVQVMIGGDRALQTMMLERGELDAVYLVQLPDLFRLSRSAQFKDTVKLVAGASTDFLAMNTEIPPFDNLKVRQAVNHAVNKNRLVSLTGGGATPARGILPPLMPGYNPELKGLPYDPERARQLLAEAGYRDGLKFELAYTEDDPRWGRAVIAIERDLNAVGITAVLKKMSLPVLYTAVQTRHRVACAYLGWSQDYPDPSNFLDVLFNGTRIQDAGGNNFAYYNNPKVNDLLAEADRSLVAAERYSRYQRVEQMIVEDAPFVPLLHQLTPVLISPRIGGFKPNAVWTMTPECWWRQ